MERLRRRVLLLFERERRCKKKKLFLVLYLFERERERVEESEQIEKKKIWHSSSVRKSSVKNRFGSSRKL